MIQCYDGGAGNVNSVGSWNFTGVSNRHAGLMYYSNDWSVEKNLAQFQKWHDDGVATGGFVWVYNSEEWDLNAWASGMNRIFGAVSVPEEKVVARFYSEKNYGGYCVSLPEGKFMQADLALYGLKANDLASMEIVDDSYWVYLYTSNNCTGTRLRRNTSMKQLASNYLDKVCSILIVPNETKINDVEASKDTDDADAPIYNVAGQRLQKMQNGVNIVNGKKILKK